MLAETLRTILETIPDLVWVKDQEGKYLMCNPKFEKFFGKIESEIIGKTDFDFVSAELAEFFRKKDNEALVAGKSLTNTEWITYADDGHLELVETIKTPMYDSLGNIIGVLGIARDITARNNAENDLRKFLLGIENSLDAIFITNINGVIEYTNNSFEKIYGFTRSEALGKTPRILKSGLIPLEGYKIFWSTLLSGNPVFGEIRNKTKDGKFIDIEASNNPIVNVDGKMIGFISINRDITEKKQVLKELVESKEKAEESDRLKTAFLNNISHEIRTPLNAITGFSALLTMPDNDAESQKMYIDSIIKSSDQLLSIVHDIIDISSIEALTSNTNITEVNLENIFKRILNQFKNEAYAKNLTLTINNSLSDNDTILLTDSPKLYRILSNLVSNAVKFTLKGNIEVGCSIKNKNIEFFVADTGIGIPADLHSKIFEKFYQAEKDLNRKFEGTGLGLAICKAFVNHLGGDIWVSSESGNGSVFYFTLPDIKPGPEEQPKTKYLEKQSDSNIKKVILVAEDDFNNFNLIKSILVLDNYEVVRAVNGFETMKILKERSDVSLIFMDVRMPEMDGYTATKEIRKTNKEVIIIAQSAYFDDKIAAIENGCNDFINKPFTMDQLMKKIKENLK